MLERPEICWIDDLAGLRSLHRSVEAAGWLAVDTESNSGFSYREQLCLLQINDGKHIWLVDLLALPGEQDALEILRPLLEASGRPKYLHGGEFDVGCFKRDFQIALGGVWDTQQAATYLGWEKTSYGAVVERLCGVSLPKAHTRHDWSQRPIAGGELEYAINDVLYLPEIATRLQEEVERADLRDEVAMACEAVEQATWNGGYRPEGLWSIKGVRQLSEKQQKILFALYIWRESIAAELDLPPGRALNNQVLVALARNTPVRLDELRRLGVPARLGPRWSAELLRQISTARQSPPTLPPQPAREPLDPEMRQRGDRLKGWRREEARRRGVPMQVVLPVAAMRYLTRHGADDLIAVPQLGAKRIRLYGEVLRQLSASPL